MAKGKLIRRLFGAACLIGAVVMLVAGETKPAAASQVGFILYWLGCLVLAGLAMAAAILDLSAVRREARADQRDLLQNALLDIEAEKKRRAAARENRDKSGLQD